MNKKFRFLPFIMALMIILSMIPFAYADSWESTGDIVSNLPMRLHLTFKDASSGKVISGATISGSYTYRWCDKDGKVMMAIKGFSAFGGIDAPLKSNSKGEIIYDMTEFNNVIHYSSGDYTEIPVNFNVTAPSGYVTTSETYSYSASYKTCNYEG